MDLNVTTACRVVLLPSNQPLGRIPGEPQLISDSYYYHDEKDDHENGKIMRMMKNMGIGSSPS